MSFSLDVMSLFVTSSDKSHHLARPRGEVRYPDPGRINSEVVSSTVLSQNKSYYRPQSSLCNYSSILNAS